MSPWTRGVLAVALVGAGLLVACGNDDAASEPTAPKRAAVDSEKAPTRLRPAVVLVNEAGGDEGWVFCVAGRAVYVTPRAVAQGAIGSCPEGPWAP